MFQRLRLFHQPIAFCSVSFNLHLALNNFQKIFIKRSSSEFYPDVAFLKTLFKY